VKLSIIISSYNRLPLLRRTLWAIANRKPSCQFEVIIVDDNSNQDILGELKRYSSLLQWTLVRFDASSFSEQTGIKKHFNNPCVTNNIGFKYSSGDLVVQQGNEVIAWGDVYDHMIVDVPDNTENFMVMSTTYDMPQPILDLLDSTGSNLTQAMVERCYEWPLQSKDYRSDVTNYISLVPARLWDKIGGYDERYFGGISSEDSDFVRRCRMTPGFKQVISEGISLHQYHGGKTRYYNPKPSVISQRSFEDGCARNHAIYHSWNGATYSNQQSWPYGTYGVKEVFSNAT
jgi:glycosyltransferase involved in cell wall biosynthesis